MFYRLLNRLSGRKIFVSRKERKIFKFFFDNIGSVDSHPILQLRKTTATYKRRSYNIIALSVNHTEMFYVIFNGKNRYGFMLTSDFNRNNLKTKNYRPFIKIITPLVEERKKEMLRVEIDNHSKNSRLMEQYLNSVD
jgi:hypothetical protein